jgi:4-diphosphocytidyl-2-C-methyl-D-erythritol kinase
VKHAHAKVNLWLNVVGRRADGYHLLDSLVAFVDLADTVAVRPADGLSLDVDGPHGAGLAAEPQNLVLTAARLLAARAGRSPDVAISLTKNIPVAAGLGGGSADAAATLQTLAELWGVSLSEAMWSHMARSLGADVPMCLAGRTALASGVGERLEPAPPLPDAAILLVNPGIALPTRDVFAARKGAFSRPVPLRGPWANAPALAEDLARRGNDLTAPATTLCRPIGKVLAALRASPDALYVGMSGSGATCFALFDSLDTAQGVAATLPPAWWHHAGRFVS